MRARVTLTIGVSLLAWAGAIYSPPASAREPELVLQRGFDEACGVAFDPGGEYWATTRDYVVLIHAQTGTVVASRPIFEPSAAEAPCAVAVASGGRRVAYADGRSLHVWDPLTDELVFSHESQSYELGGVSFSADGQRLAAVGVGSPLVVWSTDDWQPIRTLWMPTGAWQASLDASGSRVAVTGNSAWIFNVDSGSLLTELPGAELTPRFSGDGRHVMLDSLRKDQHVIVRADDGEIVQALDDGIGAFSPDGSWVAVTGEDSGSPIELRSLGDWELVAELTGHQDFVGGLAIHASPGQQLRLTASLRNSIYDYSPDGPPAAQTATWELPSGRLVRPLERRNPTFTPLLEGSPDGRWLVAASRGADVLVWDLEQGRLAQRITVPTQHRWTTQTHVPMPMIGEGVLDIAFVPGSDEVLLGTPRGAHAWSLTTRSGRAITGGSAQRLNLLEDGAMLATPAGLHRVRDGARIDLQERIALVDASDDGRLLVAIGGEPKSGHRLLVLDGQTQRELAASRAIEFVDEVAISPDAKRVAVTERVRKHDFASRTLVLDSNTGAVRQELRRARLLAWSPDSRRLILQATSGDEAILVVDARTGRTLQTLAAKAPSGHPVPAVEGVAFSADGTTLVTSTMGETVAWDLDTGDRRWTRAGSGTSVTSVAGGRMLAVHESGVVTLLELATGEPIVTLVADATDWLLHTPDGYFTGSHGADRLVATVDRLVPTRLFQTAHMRDRPDVVLERLGSSDVERVARYRALYQQRARPSDDDPIRVPELRLESLTVEGRDVEVAFTARDPGGALASCNLLVNGVPAERPALRVSGAEQRGRARVQLEPGRSWIELSVTNEQGVESYREFRQVTIDAAATVERDLYVLAFGVSEPQGSVHAGKDAEDMVRLLAHAPGFRSILTQVHVDEQVSAQAYREAAELVEHARVEDTLIVFVAGRVPGLDVEIEQLLARTPARRKLLLVGGLERERSVHGERTGAIVLSSAQEHGSFTAALLIALTSEHTDLDQDGALTLTELQRAVAGAAIERANPLSPLTLRRIDVDPSRVSELPLPSNALAPVAQQQQQRVDNGPTPHPEPRGCAVTDGHRHAIEWAAWMLMLAIIRRRAGRRRRDSLAA